MTTIRFLPDRLNANPVVFRGFTTSELGLAMLAGVIAGFALSLPLMLFFGWLIVPSVTLLFPLLVVGFGGRWLSAKKRGKPENYLWQLLALRLRQFGLGDPRIITVSQRWSLRRNVHPRRVR